MVAPGTAYFDHPISRFLNELTVMYSVGEVATAVAQQ
jgi:hypothetical protein